MNFTSEVFDVPLSRVGNEHRPDECWELFISPISHFDSGSLEIQAAELFWVHLLL